MWLNHWSKRWLGVATPCRLTRRQVAQRRSRRLQLEQLEDRLVPSATWVEQGPGVITGGLNALPDASTGAVEAIAVDPTNANIAYAGSVNGGVWKTDNATSASPVWKPLTDQQLPFLDINSLAVSPVNPNELFAGSGPTSSDTRYGSGGFGVGRSLDGGKHWQVLGAGALAGQAIRSIVPTRLNGGQVVLAGALYAGDNLGSHLLTPGGGVYRSTDGGVTWKQLSGAPGTGLPAEGVSDVIADPGNPNRFYAAVSDWVFGATGQEGVYRSDDGGQTWARVGSGLTGLDAPSRTLLAVGNSAAGNDVYAMVIAVSGDPVNSYGTLSGVFRSTDQGADWTSLATPAIDIYQGSGGDIFGAIAADPHNPNVVYISGDGDFTQPGVVEAATVMRGDASQLPNNIWTNVYSDGANNTSPHPDSRAMLFDNSGNLLYASDGGVYRLNQPNDPAARQWRFISTGLNDVEFHNVAYDPLSKVIIGGTQDNGTAIQGKPGMSLWDASNTPIGDGGFVAIDANQTAHPGTSIRYTSTYYLYNFNRSTWDANNNFLGSSPIGLQIVAGPDAGQTLSYLNPYMQFYNPIVLNTIDPTRLLIGTATLYESFDQGDTLTNLNFFNGSYVGGQSVTASPAVADGYGQPMVYGGRIGSLANPDVIWAGIGNQVVYREYLGDPLQAVSGYHGDYVQTIVADPQNYRHIFVVDGSSQVWASFDAGRTFLNITANLTQLTPFVTTIEVVSTGPGLQDQMLVAGGLNGVFALGPASFGQQPWYRLGDNLPHAVVQDLHYYPHDHLLLAGTLGRGAWSLTIPFGDMGSNVGGGGSASTAWSMFGVARSALSRPAQALDAFFAAISGNAGAADDLLIAAALVFPSPTMTVIPAPVGWTTATGAAPLSLPGGTDKVAPPLAEVSGTPTSVLTRRAAHRAVDDWGWTFC
jgi:hypothetical protein